MEVQSIKVLIFILMIVIVLNAFAALDFLSMCMWNQPVIPKSNTSLRLVIGISGIIFFIAFIAILLRFGHYLIT